MKVHIVDYNFGKKIKIQNSYFAYLWTNRLQTAIVITDTHIMKLHIPVDCEWNSWSSWSTCSTTCDSGIKSRTRTKSRDESPSGICEGSANDQKSCKIKSCPCIWGDWSNWSSCSTTCDAGIESRTRIKSSVESPGGICEGSANDQKSCKMQPCPGKYFIQTVCLIV